MSHARGPWQAVPHDERYGRQCWKVWDEAGLVRIASVGDDSLLDYGEANARLIAAAPDLLEVCLHALEVIEICDNCDVLVNTTREELWKIAETRMRAAIAKATCKPAPDSAS